MARAKRVFLQTIQHGRTMKKRDKILQEAKARLVAGLWRQDQGRDSLWLAGLGQTAPLVGLGFFWWWFGGEYDWKTVSEIRGIMAYLDLDFDVFTQTLVISESDLLHSLRGAQPVFQKAKLNGIYA
jgi:hypothetical protein